MLEEKMKEVYSRTNLHREVRRGRQRDKKECKRERRKEIGWVGMVYCFTFIASSIRTGGTFSPPAVMMSSLIRPVI